MRFRSLDLEAYGLFSNRRLRFDDEAKLHIVYGANEAGKSTALSAVADALFGMDRKSGYDFSHSLRDLRLSACIVDSCGRELSFRRAFYKPQVTALDGAPLTQEALTPFLGELDRETFLRAFGLDANGLRKAQEELSSNKGELGAALFAAASGLRGMSALKQAFEGEAEENFGPRAKKSRRFDQAKERYDNARRALRESQMHVGKLKELREEIDKKRAERESLNQERFQIEEGIAALQRLRRTEPLLKQIAEARDLLAQSPSNPHAPEGFGATLLKAIETARDAERNARTSDEKHFLRQEELKALQTDAPLLARERDIDALEELHARSRTAKIDLPRVIAEYDISEQELDHLARRVGLADAQVLRERQPSDAALASLRAFLREGDGLFRQYETWRADLARKEKNLAAKKDSAPGAAADPKQWRGAFKRLESARRAIDERKSKEEELARQKNALEREARALTPPIQTLSELAAFVAPPREAVEQLEHEGKAAGQELLGARQYDDSAKENKKQAAQALVRYDGDAPPPRRGDLIEARAKRRDAFLLLTAAAFENPVKRESERVKILLEFEEVQRRADDLADAMISNATRGAEYEQALLRLEEAEKNAVLAVAKKEEVQRRRKDLEERVREVWRGLPDAPAFGAMLHWRERALALQEQERALAAGGEALRTIEQNIASAEAPLLEIGAHLKLDLNPALSMESLFARIQEGLEAAAEAFEAMKLHNAGFVEIQNSLREAQEECVQVDARLAQWKNEFAAKIACVGLDSSADRAAAHAALDAWSAAPAKFLAQIKLQGRIDGMRRDAREFAEEIEKLCADLGGEWPSDPLEAWRALDARRKAAREQEGKRAALARHCEEARLEADDKRLTAQSAMNDLEELARRWDLAESPPDLERIEERARSLVRRDQLNEGLAEKRARLEDVGDGFAEDVLQAALEGFDRQAAEDNIARLKHEKNEKEQRAEEALAAMFGVERQLEAHEKSQAAEMALQNKCNAETDMMRAARDHLVKKFATLLIGSAIERHRETLQNPLLARSGDFFARLTGGAFVGVGQIYDEDDRPLLAGRRADGSLLPIEAANARRSCLSEGARDQLFLSLRLAYLDYYAAANEAPPFLADDLFVSFDDARTAHGLDALIEIGARVQPILFTHHRFVVDIARKNFADRAQIIDLSGLTEATQI